MGEFAFSDDFRDLENLQLAIFTLLFIVIISVLYKV
jgi:hypothetical protein